MLKVRTYTNVGIECKICEADKTYATLSDAFIKAHEKMTFALRFSANRELLSRACHKNGTSYMEKSLLRCPTAMLCHGIPWYRNVVDNHCPFSREGWWLFFYQLFYLTLTVFLLGAHPPVLYRYHSQRETVQIYLEDGRCRFTDNLSENGIRPFVMERRTGCSAIL